MQLLNCTSFFSAKSYFFILFFSQLSKLLALNIPPHLVFRIFIYLHGRKQRVVVSGANSASVDVLPGVATLRLTAGPLLFLICVDGLAEMLLLSSILKMFADDPILYKAIYNPMSDFQDLQKDIDSFAQWIANHVFELTFKKCKSLLLSKRRLPLCTHTVVVNGLAYLFKDPEATGIDVTTIFIMSVGLTHWKHSIYLYISEMRPYTLSLCGIHM